MLRSSIVEGRSIDPVTTDGPSHDVTNDLLVPGCMCAIVANEKSTNTVWFVKILEKREADQPYTDYYSFIVAKDQEFFSGKCWNKLAKHLFKKRKLCFSTRPVLFILSLTLKKTKAYIAFRN